MVFYVADRWTLQNFLGQPDHAPGVKGGEVSSTAGARVLHWANRTSKVLFAKDRIDLVWLVDFALCLAA